MLRSIVEIELFLIFKLCIYAKMNSLKLNCLYALNNQNGWYAIKTNKTKQNQTLINLLNDPRTLNFLHTVDGAKNALTVLPKKVCPG